MTKVLVKAPCILLPCFIPLGEALVKSLIDLEVDIFLFLLTTCVFLVKNAELTYLWSSMFLWLECCYKNGLNCISTYCYLEMMYLHTAPEGIDPCSSWPLY